MNISHRAEKKSNVDLDYLVFDSIFAVYGAVNINLYFYHGWKFSVRGLRSVTGTSFCLLLYSIKLAFSVTDIWSNFNPWFLFLKRVGKKIKW